MYISPGPNQNNNEYTTDIDNIHHQIERILNEDNRNYIFWPKFQPVSIDRKNMVYKNKQLELYLP